MRITVLRLGHRPERDKRITTHVALTARALGASSFLLAGDDDPLLASVAAVVKRFGGPFEARAEPSWRTFLARFDGFRVHLTMYGERFADGIAKVPRDGPVCIVVGAEKVPRAVYDLVDLNLAVGNQPHSEVAALALSLYELGGRERLEKPFEKAQVRIAPSARGKVVEGAGRAAGGGRGEGRVRRAAGPAGPRGGKGSS